MSNDFWNNERDRYPLSWPIGWIRTPASKRQQASFKVSFAKARDELLEELERMQAIAVVISSNIPLRQDGLPYAKFKMPVDPGVAVYFQLGIGAKRKPHVLACDRWLTVRHNLRAIGLHVAAIRGIARWGVGSIEQAFFGYQALPQADNNGKSPWWKVLDVSPDASLDVIKTRYRHLARQHHPDNQGNHEQMSIINRAWEEAQMERQRS